jgi:TonB-linked SusC/RagA family outer membrane protein
VIVNGIPIRNGDANNTGYCTDQRIRSNGLIDINPEDIESLSILKGAAASALYGSEAANGVVIITTKSGKAKQGIGVEVSANFTADQVAYMPKYQTVFGPGARVGGRTAGYNQDSGGFWERNWNGQTYKSIQTATGMFGPKYDGSDILYFDGTVRKYEAIGDPWSETFRTAYNQNYNIAVTQGNENGNMRISYTYLNSIPNQYNSDYNKNNFSINGSYSLNKNLKIDYTANYIVQYIKNRPYRISRLTNNFSGMANAWTDVKYIREHTITSRGYRNVIAPNRTPTEDESFAYDWGSFALVEEYFWNIFGKEEYENNNRLLGSVTPSWQIINGLKLQGRIATDLTSSKIENKERSERPLAYGDPTGYYGLLNRRYEEVYGDIMLMFDKKITESVGIVANAGWMGRTEKMFSSRVGTDGGLTVENWYHINSSRNKAGASQGMSDFLKTGLFASVGVSYNSFLYLEGTGRQEKISTLAKGSNSFFYPSLNASLIYTDAFKDNLPSWYDYGKIRASYGVVGNAPEIYKASVAYQQSTASGYIYNLTKDELGNEKLVPEEKQEFELGWENKMFRNRFGFEVSYYRNVIKDQILRTDMPITTGGSRIWMNVGELNNKGVEFSVYGTPIQTKDYFWEVRANLVSNKNTVTKLAEGLSVLVHENIDNGAVTIESHVGEPMGDIYAYDVKKDANGNVIIGDDGFALLTDERVKVGNAMPKLTGGFSTAFGFKNLVLDVVLDFRIGGSMINVPYEYLMGRGSLVETMKWRDAENGGMSYYFKDNNHGAGICVPFNGKAGSKGPNGEIVYDNGIILDGVKQDGSKNDIMIPSDVWYNWTYNWGTDEPTYYSHSVFDNTYCKVREIALSYNLPAKLTHKFACRNLTVSVFGRNLFYLYKNLPIFDVEATDGTSWVSQSSIGGSTATTRTFGVSLRASF